MMPHANSLHISAAHNILHRNIWDIPFRADVLVLLSVLELWPPVLRFHTVQADRGEREP